MTAVSMGDSLVLSSKLNQKTKEKYLVFFDFGRRSNTLLFLDPVVKNLKNSFEHSRRQVGLAREGWSQTVNAGVNSIQLTALSQFESERLDQMMQAHGRLVFSIAFSILRNSHDAEDVAQEVFFRMIRYRYRMVFIRDERTFLCRMAQRAAIDHRKRRRETISTDEIPEPAASPCNDGKEEALDLLAALVQALPPEMRAVIELSQVEEMTSEQIGKVLGIPAGTVRSRVARAKHLLREKWKAKMEETHVRISR